MAALQPLNLSFIMEALKIDLERRTLDDDIVPTHEIGLLDVCGSLVMHNVETDIVSLSHFSVKEYLMGDLICGQLPQYYIGSQEYAHEQLARLCMCYLSLVGHPQESVKNKCPSIRLTVNAAISTEAAESFDTNLLSQPLLRYALSRGFNHLHYLGLDHGLVFCDMKALEYHIQQCPRRWQQIRDSLSTDSEFRYYYAPHWSDPRHDFILYILICFGSVSLLDRYLDCDDLAPKAGTNPLVYATHFNEAQHAQVLLSRGARVNDIGCVAGLSGYGQESQYLPLEVAVKKSAVELVDLLLAAESRVPEKLFQTSVSPATRVPLRIIRSLLRTDEFAEWAIDQCQNKPWLLHELLSQRYAKWEQDDLVTMTR
ncbi:hypothetical protein PAXINDRAFT_12128 [Paxillus involutus ATCC 200175]|uniref:Uncharacterized protein n=1 Tax=Paxillus involutus ATCC 200175 TaxID=664439 RepID=A0A0C9THT5_PAXIN|nr:hypothetical protein PAXINDRAFT_12128 [Paxillus involutus ATCC 200175]